MKNAPPLRSTDRLATGAFVHATFQGHDVLVPWAAFTGSIEAEGTLDFAGVVSQDGNILATEAGTGITGGTGTVYKSAVEIVGGLIKTTIIIDLTGLNSMNTDGDIIGVNDTANPCHIGQITAARNGTIIGGRVTCLEAPAGGDPNIALYSATEATGVENGAIGGLTETLIADPNADHTLGLVTMFSADVAADQYLYLVQGDATGTDGTYTAGRLMIELFGTQ